MSAINTDGENSMYVELEELRENDYVLSTNRYMIDEEDIKEAHDSLD